MNIAILNQGFTVKGEISYQVEDEFGNDTGKGHTKNMVLDGFYVWFLAANRRWTTPTIKLGTGTTPVTASQSDLANWGKTFTSVSSDLPNGEVVSGKIRCLAKLSKDSGIGGATGTWTELGLDWAGSGVQTRLLFEDIGGQPTSITVLVNEKLIINYTLTFDFELVDDVSTQVLLGETRTVTTRSGSATIKLSSRFMDSTTWYQTQLAFLGTSGSIGAAGEYDSRNILYRTLATSSIGNSTGLLTASKPETSVQQICNGINVNPVETTGSALYKVSIDPPIIIPPDNTLTVQYQLTSSKTV